MGGEGTDAGGEERTEDRVESSPSSSVKRAGSMEDVLSAMTGFSASTTSLAASGSVDSSRQYTYLQSTRSHLEIWNRANLRPRKIYKTTMHSDPSLTDNNRVYAQWSPPVDLPVRNSTTR